MSAAMVLELSEGCELVIDGESWRVEKLEPYWGNVTLRSDDGGDARQRQTSIAALMRHRDCRASSRSSQRAAGRGASLSRGRPDRAAAAAGGAQARSPA